MTNYQYQGIQRDTACADKIGTLAGRQRHRRAGEQPCDYCRAAHNNYNRVWRIGRSKPTQTALANRIRQRALIKLKAMYPEDYERLKRAEWIAEVNRKENNDETSSSPTAQ